MKKNKMMRLASGLLVAVLLTTCTISGTFAKYITEDSAMDSARVAKWGVDVVVEADSNDVLGAFAKVYANDGEKEKDKAGNEIVNTVEAQFNVVAPGTKGDLMKNAEITGIPEVAVNVKQEATLELSGWEVDVTDDNTVNPTYYCPIIIKVDNDANKTFYGLDYDSEAEFIAAVEEVLDSDINYVPNTDLEEKHSVTWEWAFEGAANSEQTDVKDTALGDAAMKGDITIKFTYKATVTQLD